MKILLLCSPSPWPPDNGAKMRNWAILRALAMEGHELTLVTFRDADHAPENSPRELRDLCRAVVSIPHRFRSLSLHGDYAGRALQLFSREPYGAFAARSEAMKAGIEELLDAWRPDAVLCEETDLLVNLPAVCLPLIVDFHNVDHLILERYIPCERNPAKRAYAVREARRVKCWEAIVCARAAVASACSEHDRAILQRNRPDLPMFVVPNVLDAETYTPAMSEEPKRILFQGGMDWFPNRDAVEFFASDIFPLVRSEVADARFVVAGRNPPEEFQRRICRTDGIEFTGAVPDMRREIAAAAVSVIPLRIGSGTRLKILEGAAMAKPMVSTSLGAEGLEFLDGKEICIADQPRGFASAVAGFLNSAEDRRRFGQAARKRLEQQYSLPAARAALAQVMEQASRAARVPAHSPLRHQTVAPK